MRAGIDTAPAIAAVDERRILDLEQRSIRISSPTFQEGEIADLYAHAMADIGLEVEMMEILHPQDPTKKSRQPIGRLRGSGAGPTLLLNGHMESRDDRRSRCLVICSKRANVHRADSPRSRDFGNMRLRNTEVHRVPVYL